MKIRKSGGDLSAPGLQNQRATSVRAVGATVEPDVPDGDVPELAHGTYQSSRYVASYLDLRPIEDGPIQARWAKVITPYRATLHARLYLTERWYRPAIVLMVITMIVLVLTVA